MKGPELASLEQVAGNFARNPDSDILADPQIARSFFENCGECITVLDLDGRLLYISGPGQRLLEISELDNYLGHNWLGSWEGEDYQKASAAVSVAKAGGTGNFQGFRATAQGNPRWWDVIVAPIRDNNGQVERLLGISRDVTAQNQAEETIRKSEAQFRNLADAIPQLCWMANADGWIFWYNERWYEYTGTTPEEMEGWGWQSVHDPGTLAAVLEGWRASIAAAEPFEMVFPLRGANGVFRHFLTRVRPLRNGEGRVIRWFGTNTDVTELRQAQEALSLSEERLRLALSSACFGTFDVNPLTGELGWDAQMKRIWGVEPDEEIDLQRASQRLHPADSERVLALLAAVLSPGAYCEYETEYRLVWPDGSVRWSSANGRVYFEGEGERRHAVRFIGVQRDITKVKEAEEALRQSEERFRRLSEANIIGIYEANLRTMTRSNDEFLRVIGYSRAEFEAGSIDWQRMTPPEFAPRDQHGLEQLRERGWCEPFEKEYMRKDGRRVPILIGAALLTREPLTWIGFVLDLTMQKQTELALIRSEKLASVGRMAATIAHEINNPLAGVTNSVFLAKTNADSPEQVRQTLELADHELRRIAHLTRQTLGFYRESSSPAVLSVDGVLDSAIDLLKSKIQTKHANLQKQFEGEVELFGVAGELRQIFCNLLSNSLDAIAPGGTIRVSLSHGNDAQSEQRVVVSVADDGTGIKPDALPRIFEPFFTTKADVGTGLGLWITQQLVERHGGSISVQSATDGEHRGTTFSVVLPANTPRPILQNG